VVSEEVAQSASESKLIHAFSHFTVSTAMKQQTLDMHPAPDAFYAAVLPANNKKELVIKCLVSALL
jgi:hypothetical protein